MELQEILKQVICVDEDDLDWPRHGYSGLENNKIYYFYKTEVDNVAWYLFSPFKLSKEEITAVIND